MDIERNWQLSNSETFWREIATCSHVVQLYENDTALLDLLEGFVTGGISVGDCVVLIATPYHLFELEQRLGFHGLNVDTLRASGQYIALDAKEVLAKFMVNDWPDYTLFVETISQVFEQAGNTRRPIRAFGEMVAILWEQGNSAATVMLEHLWNAYSEKEDFALFCAYPKAKFTEDSASSLSNICKAHSKIITNSGVSRFDLSYQNIETPS